MFWVSPETTDASPMEVAGVVAWVTEVMAVCCVDVVELVSVGLGCLG